MALGGATLRLLGRCHGGELIALLTYHLHVSWKCANNPSTMIGTRRYASSGMWVSTPLVHLVSSATLIVDILLSVLLFLWLFINLFGDG